MARPSWQHFPPELWLKVLGFLPDFASLHNFGLCSKAEWALLVEFESLLYFRISVNLGFTAKHSFGSSKTIYPRNAVSHLGALSDQTEEEDVQRALKIAIKNQQTMIKSVFNPIETWKQFAVVKSDIEHRWQEGRRASHLTVSVMAASEPMSIWRWKFDVDYEYWAATLANGGLTVVSSPTTKSRRWYSDNTQPYSHLESSGPYLITTSTRSEFLVWRRRDCAFTTPGSPGGQSDTSLTRKELFGAHGRRIGWQFFNSEPMFELLWVLDMPHPARCFKARAPFLAAGCPSGQKIYIWALETGKLIQEIETSPGEVDEMAYIELDDSFVFLAIYPSVKVYDRRSGQLIHRFGIHQSPLFHYGVPSEWQAVHHDVDGGHLLALTGDGWLLWTPRYRPVIQSDSQSYKESQCVMINLGHMGGRGHNLCVENNRAVISVLMEYDDSCLTVGGLYYREKLFVLNLRDWVDYEDLISNPPILITLFEVVPSLILTSRIEMDSCAVYLTCAGMSHHNAEDDEGMMTLWQDVNGGYLDHAPNLEAHEYWVFKVSGEGLCRLSTIEAQTQCDQGGVSKETWDEAVEEWNAEVLDWDPNDGEKERTICRVAFAEEGSFKIGAVS